jgi:hypothetical protein
MGPAIVCPRSNRLAECVTTPGGSPPLPPTSRQSATSPTHAPARSRASSRGAPTCSPQAAGSATARGRTRRHLKPCCRTSASAPDLSEATKSGLLISRGTLNAVEVDPPLDARQAFAAASGRRRQCCNCGGPALGRRALLSSRSRSVRLRACSSSTTGSLAPAGRARSLVHRRSGEGSWAARVSLEALPRGPRLPRALAWARGARSRARRRTSWSRSVTTELGARSLGRCPTRARPGVRLCTCRAS